jgi:hypothetical protein
MPVVISLDVTTGQRTAIAPGFRAVLPRSRLNPDWYTINVTEGQPEIREQLRDRLGTLDDLKRAMEAAL